jgi:hypothetical protein
LFTSFIDNLGEIEVSGDVITIKMNRKRALPLLKESLPDLNAGYLWLGGKKLVFTAGTHS